MTNQELCATHPEYDPAMGEPERLPNKYGFKSFPCLTCWQVLAWYTEGRRQVLALMVDELTSQVMELEDKIVTLRKINWPKGENK